MRNITAITDLPFNIPPIEDITDSLPKHSTKVYPMRNIEDIDTITVHHMASDAPLINQAAYHVNGRGWAAIGYTLVIYEGRLYQCNDLLAQTNHSAGHNHHSVSISIHGDLSKRPMTSQERELLYAGILTLKYYLPHIKYIAGHNEQGKTSCPCTSMNQIREDIASLEEQIQFKASDSNQNKEIYESVIRLNDLYDKWINKEGKYSKEIQQEALRKLTNLHGALKEKQYI